MFEQIDFSEIMFCYGMDLKERKLNLFTCDGELIIRFFIDNDGDESPWTMNDHLIARSNIISMNNRREFYKNIQLIEEKNAKEYYHRILLYCQIKKIINW